MQLLCLIAVFLVEIVFPDFVVIVDLVERVLKFQCSDYIWCRLCGALCGRRETHLWRHHTLAFSRKAYFRDETGILNLQSLGFLVSGQSITRLYNRWSNVSDFVEFGLSSAQISLFPFCLVCVPFNLPLSKGPTERAIRFH